jgi:hypothetical protein
MGKHMYNFIAKSQCNGSIVVNVMEVLLHLEVRSHTILLQEIYARAVSKIQIHGLPVALHYHSTIEWLLMANVNQKP